MRLVAFDFDGTLSPSEMFLPLADRMGVAADVADITERAMNDEISYAESLRERAAMLEGLTDEQVEEAYAELELRAGAADLIQDLRDAGHHVAVLTGGFEDAVEQVLADAGVEVDSIVANRLPSERGRLTGEVEGPLIEGTKDRELERLADELDLGMERTVAVGDGANDLPMLEVAHLAIGMEPKPAVRPHCDEIVDSMADLDSVLEAHGVLPHGR